jgi:hypothetical protein
MSGPTSSASRLPGYNLAVPTEADALSALERVFGAERGRALWSDACAMAGLGVGKASTGAALERAVQSLASQGGAAATVARSMSIRMRTYDQLAARGASAATGARS